MSKPKTTPRTFTLVANGRPHRLTFMDGPTRKAPPRLALSMCSTDGVAHLWIEPVLTEGAESGDFEAVFLAACARLARSTSRVHSKPGLASTAQMVRNNVEAAVEINLRLYGPRSMRMEDERPRPDVEEMQADHAFLTALTSDRCRALGEMTEDEAGRLIALSKVVVEEELKSLGRRKGG